MILSSHQPGYLPWLGYFHKIALSDNFVILDDVQFEKNSFINRNKIKNSYGSIWLTVPVLIKGHTKKTIKEIEINNNINWKKKHWKSIYQNYKKAPYFYKYSDFFEELYKQEWKKIIDLLIYTLYFFIKELDIKTNIYQQSNLNITSSKQQLILDLCKYFNSKLFIFGVLGKNYVDRDLFKKENIKVYFQEYKHPVYPQLWQDFIENLSIIDLLFNVGKEKTKKIIMEGNIIKKDLQILIE